MPANFLQLLDGGGEWAAPEGADVEGTKRPTSRGGVPANFAASFGGHPSGDVPMATHAAPVAAVPPLAHVHSLVAHLRSLVLSGCTVTYLGS